MPSRYRYAVVCSSNQNRSMEAHCFLLKRDFNVQSYGTGNAVKLPGPAIDQPNIYQFGTPYDLMYRELSSKNHQLYTQNGVLNMLDRNRNTKVAPERFQETPLHFDVVISCEERVFDQILEAFNNREEKDMTPVHVLNLDIKDDHENATLGSFLIYDLCQMVEQSDDLEADMDSILERFQAKTKQRVLHSLEFY
eukprot:comp20068_c0_seq1/m.24688 comp20068_c0_seq1/g.24688  ORF comp20068_c0_seq1/g.24688 comp20068_c0_seq1/m.24688 type:complete len:194 (-) comp20068_c0_seq1:706-1287(-)